MPVRSSGEWHEVYGWGGLKQVKPLEEAQYGLYPAFLDGMLEAVKPQGAIVDGYESAYGFKQESQFERARDEGKRKAMQLSGARQLYDKHVQAGFGLMVNYDGGKRWNTRGFTRTYFSPAEFQQVVKAALKISNRYVWVYSQTPRFFPPAQLPDVYLTTMRAGRLGEQQTINRR